MTTQPIQIYWSLMSQPGRAVKSLISLLNIPCTFKQINLLNRESRSKQYLALYPAGKIPLLRQKDFILGESPAIMSYLCTLHKSPLKGKSLAQQAQINEYLGWYQRRFRPALFKPIRLLLQGLFTGKPVNGEQYGRLFADVTVAMGQLQTRLSGNKGQFLAGQFSTADLLYYFEITNLKLFKIKLTTYKNVDKWFKTVGSIPEIKKIQDQFQELGLADLLSSVQIENGSKL